MIDCGGYAGAADDNAKAYAGRADMQRDGEWALNALRRVVENGGGSESVGCRVDSLINDDVRMNAAFARLLVAAIAALSK